MRLPGTRRGEKGWRLGERGRRGGEREKIREESGVEREVGGGGEGAEVVEVSDINLWILVTEKKKI